MSHSTNAPSFRALDHLDVVLFTKAPRAGEVKTRLGKEIGMQEAAELHGCFVRLTARRLERFAALLNADAALPSCRLTLERADATYHEQLDEEILRSKRASWRAHTQRGASLGDRLAAALKALPEAGGALDEGVLIVGSDSPTLPLELLSQAERALSHHDVVIGPSFDGGYYLIAVRLGSRASRARVEARLLFEAIAWSTPEVLSQTLGRCQALGLRAHLLPFWYDVDTIEDLRLMSAHLRQYLVASPGDADYSELIERLERIAP